MIHLILGYVNIQDFGLSISIISISKSIQDFFFFFSNPQPIYTLRGHAIEWNKSRNIQNTLVMLPKPKPPFPPLAITNHEQNLSEITKIYPITNYFNRRASDLEIAYEEFDQPIKCQANWPTNTLGSEKFSTSTRSCTFFMQSMFHLNFPPILTNWTLTSLTIMLPIKCSFFNKILIGKATKCWDQALF